MSGGTRAPDAGGRGGIHPLREMVVPGDHGQKRPAVPLVKGGVVRHQVEPGDPHGAQVPPDEVQQAPGGPAAPPGGLHKQGAEIGRQVLPVVEVVCDDAGPGQQAPAVPDHVPLGNRRLPAEALLHALPVGLRRDSPAAAEPDGGRVRQDGRVPQGENGLFHTAPF